MNNTREQFLQTLQGDGEYMNFCQFAPYKGVWFRSLAEVKIPEDENWYVSVFPCGEIPPESKKGSTNPEHIRTQIKYVHRLNCLFAEFDLDDGKENGKAQKKYFRWKSKEEALAYIRTLPLPSVIIDSGHGYHVYWFLDEPFIINTEEELTRGENYLHKWNDSLKGADPSAKDLARVLRIPGTINAKKKLPKVPVEFVYSNFDNKYPDIESLLYLVTDTDVVDSPPEPLPEESGLVPDGFIHNEMTKLAGRLRKAGHGSEFVEDALWAFYDKECEHPPDEDKQALGMDIKSIATSFEASEPKPLSGKQINENALALARAGLHPWKESEFTLVDAFKPRPPREYLIEGLIQKASLIMPYGRPGGFKSGTSIQMGLCVAAGITFLDPSEGSTDAVGFKCNQGRVAYIDFDAGRDDMNEKCEAFARGLGLDPEEIPFIYYTIPQPRFNARDPNSVALLKALIAEKELAMVIIDNLGLISGGADENSAEMIHVLDPLRELAEQTRIALVVIHHERKSTGFNTRAGERLRGFSGIEAAVNMGLAVEREDGSDIVTFYGGKVRGAPVRSFSALWTYTHKPGTVELHTARFFGIYKEDRESDTAVREIILDVLTESEELLPKTKLVKTICDNCDARRERVSALLDLLVTEETLIIEPGKHNAKIYKIRM